MVKRLAAVALGLSLCASPSHAETAAQALHEYDTGSADDHHVIEDVIVSEFDGVYWAQTYSVKVRHNPPIYCRGDAPVMTPTQMVEAVRDVITKSPDYGNLSLGASVVIALTEKYRCPA